MSTDARDEHGVPEERPPIGERAAQLAIGAIQHAAHYLADDGSFMAVALGEGTREDLVHELLRPEGAHPETRGVFPMVSGGDLDPLREYVAERLDGLDAYALVADALVGAGSDAARDPAIVVEVAVRGEPCAHVAIACYRPRSDDEAFELAGDRGIIDVVPSLFAEAS